MSQPTQHVVETILNELVDHLKAGNPQAAAERAREALEKVPDEPNILRIFGTALMQLGDLQDAEIALTLSTRAAPDVAIGHEQRGIVLAAQGKLDAALEAFREALRLDPLNIQIQSSIEQIFTAIEESSAQSTTPSSPITPPLSDDSAEQSQELMARVVGLLKDKDFDQAETLLNGILVEQPDNIDALTLSATMARQRRDLTQTELLLRKVLALQPTSPMANSNLAALLSEEDQFEEANSLYIKAIDLDPENSQWACNLGQCYLKQGNEEQALQTFQKVLKLDPTNIVALINCGDINKTLGNQDVAIEAYRQGIAHHPSVGEFYWSLSEIKTLKFNDEDINEMERQLEGELPEESAISFCFALGKAYEAQKNFDKAFRYLKRGNDNKRELVRYDPQETEDLANRIVETFTREFFDVRKGWGYQDRSPIFILGLPRSGSTLVEQILVSHTQVEGTRELANIPQTAQKIGHSKDNTLKYPAKLEALDADVFRQFGQAYISETTHLRSGLPHFTDKMPNNFFHIGLIHLILPNATIIDARRHPLDTCFSTWKQMFAKGQTFSYSLSDIGHYYRQYMRIMTHWDDVLPGKVLHVQYEDVVTDAETQARRMLAHCDLDWEEAVLRFYETERAVRTASSEQVRQPIYTGAKDFWKNYEPHLGELIEALGPVLDDMPEHLTRPT